MCKNIAHAHASCSRPPFLPFPRRLWQRLVHNDEHAIRLYTDADGCGFDYIPRGNILSPNRVLTRFLLL